jgi:hypothetical protein
MNTLKNEAKIESMSQQKIITFVSMLPYEHSCFSIKLKLFEGCH